MSAPRYGNTKNFSAMSEQKGPLLDLTTYGGPGGLECPHLVNVRAKQIQESRNCVALGRIRWGDPTFDEQIEFDCLRGALVAIPTGKLSIEAFLEPPPNITDCNDVFEYKVRVWAGCDRARQLYRTRNLGDMTPNQSISVPIPPYSESAEVVCGPNPPSQVRLEIVGDGGNAVGRATQSITLHGVGNNLLVTNLSNPKMVFVIFKLTL